MLRTYDTYVFLRQPGQRPVKLSELADELASQTPMCRPARRSKFHATSDVKQPADKKPGLAGDDVKLSELV